MKLWRIKRWVIEIIDVEAETRAEAMDGPENPHSVTITKETCVEVKLDQK